MTLAIFVNRLHALIHGMDVLVDRSQFQTPQFQSSDGTTKLVKAICLIRVDRSKSNQLLRMPCDILGYEIVRNHQTNVSRVQPKHEGPIDRLYGLPVRFGFYVDTS